MKYISYPTAVKLILASLLLLSPAAGSEEEGVITASLTEATGMMRVGSITLHGRERRIFVVDQNRNGKFNDVFKIPEAFSQDGRLIRLKCDTLYIETDPGGGSFQDYGSGGDEGQIHVAKMIGFEGRYYTLEVTPAGDRLTLKPWTSPMGYVATPLERYTVVLYGELGTVTIQGDGGQKHAIPAGKWRLLRYSLDQTPRNRSGSLVSGRPTYALAEGTRESPVIEVKEGKTVLMPFGPPYRALVKVRGMFDRGSGASKKALLGLEITGTGGEALTALIVNGSKPRSPKLVISDGCGEVVERGSFKFG